MKRIARSVLALALAISILVLPTASLAEGFSMAAVSADNFQLIVGESTLDIEATLRMSAGIDESLGRGLLVADVLGGNANVLQVLLAMEDSQIKGYMQNDLGGLSHLIEIPLEDIQALLETVTSNGANLQQALPITGAFSKGFANIAVPAYFDRLTDLIKDISAEKFDLRTTGQDSIRLFDQAVEAQVYEAKLDLAQYLTLIEQTAESDALLKAIWQQAEMLYRQESGNAITEVPALLEEAGIKTAISLRIYEANESAGRIVTDVLVSIGDRQVPVGIVLDYNAAEGNNAFRVELNATSPDEGAVSMYAQSSDVVEEGAVEGTAAAGISVTTDGELSEVAFSILRRSTEASGVMTGDSMSDIIGKQTSGQGAATDSATILVRANIPEEQLDASLEVQYEGTHYDQNGEPAYFGTVSCEMAENGAKVGTLAFNTEYRLSRLPEGVLLTSDEIESLNLLRTDEASLAMLQESAMTVLQNSLTLVRQTPGLTALFE